MITLNTSPANINVTSSSSGVTLNTLVERKIVTSSDVTPGIDSNIITTTTQTAIQNGSGTGQVVVGYISIYNNSAVTTTVTVKHYDGSSINSILYKADLSEGDKIEYTDANGFTVKRSQALTISGNTAKAALASSLVSNITTLTSSGVTINTQASVIYKIEGFISFSSDTLTTGIKLGLIDTGSGTVVGSLSSLISVFPVETEVKMPLVTMTDILTTTGVSVINSAHSAKIEFIYKCITSGSITLSFGAEIAATNITLLTPTYLISTII
jgi:hypothetical protein